MQSLNNGIPSEKGVRIYDCIGVGFGPSNIALAISLEEHGLLENALFLESGSTVAWQPGMLLPGTDIQHNPLRDLVTPRDPTSKYGFLSYLKSQKRLLEFLNLSSHYPPRSEYAGYVEWVGNQFLRCVQLCTRVTTIKYIRFEGETLFRVEIENGDCVYGKTVSFGPGRSNNIPTEFSGCDEDDVVHLTDYLNARSKWGLKESAKKLSVTVVGGSQSAGEIILDLINCQSVETVRSITRGFGFKQKDLSAFTEKIYTPEFTDYFHALEPTIQNGITKELWRSNYGAADPDIIEALNIYMYEQLVTGKNRLSITENTVIESIDKSKESEKYTIVARDKNNGNIKSFRTDKIILATGFKNFGNGDSKEPMHPLLNSVSKNVKFRTDGGISIDRNYKMEVSAKYSLPPLYVNGLCEASHGFGDAGSFSLLSIRSETIAAAMSQHLADRSDAISEAISKNNPQMVSD